MFWKVLLAVFLTLAFYSCKKSSNDQESQQTSPLLEDGPMSATFGKRINLERFDNLKYLGNYWGRNSEELFISAATQLLRLDLAKGEVEVLENSGGLFTGKTNENNAIIFIGTINGTYGYYTYDFYNRSMEIILPLSPSQVSKLSMSGNNVFFYTATQGPPINPCNSIWDLWCSNAPSIVSSSFYHLDKNTKALVLLKDKGFVAFSKDGTKALLANQPNRDSLYMFDNVTRVIVDSFPALAFGPLFYEQNDIRHIEVTGGLLDQITIKSILTGQTLHRFTASAKFLHQAIKWSEDGTQLYYLGATGLNSFTMLLNVYDLTLQQEKSIASFSLDQGGGSPVTLDEIILSPDNKRILIRYVNDLYIKDL